MVSSIAFHQRDVSFAGGVITDLCLRFYPLMPNTKENDIETYITLNIIKYYDKHFTELILKFLKIDVN